MCWSTYIVCCSFSWSACIWALSRVFSFQSFCCIWEPCIIWLYIVWTCWFFMSSGRVSDSTWTLGALNAWGLVKGCPSLGELKGWELVKGCPSMLRNSIVVDVDVPARRWVVFFFTSPCSHATVWLLSDRYLIDISYLVHSYHHFNAIL